MPSIALSGIRAVVFDLDDTLYPERSFAFSGFDAVAEWLRARMPCPPDVAARMRELFEGGHRGRVFDQLLAELGCGEPETWVPAMVACYRAHAPSIRLYPDAAAALARWRDGFRLGLISDGPAGMQQRKIDALGLTDKLEHIILTDRWGRSFWKPHPRSYREMETALEVGGRQCVYVGDNPEKDFLAPRAIGWCTVRVRRPDGVYRESLAPAGGEAEWDVASLSEIEITS